MFLTRWPRRAERRSRPIEHSRCPGVRRRGHRRALAPEALENRDLLCFFAAVNDAVGTGPRSVTVGDLNGNSSPDLAVTDRMSDNVSAPSNAIWSSGRREGRDASMWQAVAPSPIPRFEAQSAVVNDQLYVLGGFYNSAIQATPQIDVYDPGKDTWTRLSDMPLAVTHAGVAVDGQTIYLAGGFVDDPAGGYVTDRVLRYDVASDAWSDAPPLPEARGAGGLVRLDRELHFFSGLNADGEDRADHWILDLDGGTGWRDAAPMPNPRNHFGYTELDGKIYAIGGQHHHDEQSGNQADVHAYDPSTDSWTAVASLPFPRGHTHTGTFVSDGRIVIVGGQGNGDDRPRTLADVTEYDPVTDTWVELLPLPEPRQAAVAQRIGEWIIVTTGATQDLEPTTTTWIAAAMSSQVIDLGGPVYNPATSKPRGLLPRLPKSSRSWSAITGAVSVPSSRWRVPQAPGHQPIPACPGHQRPTPADR